MAEILGYFVVKSFYYVSEMVLGIERRIVETLSKSILDNGERKGGDWGV
jgi:hypothetical protein